MEIPKVQIVDGINTKTGQPVMTEDYIQDDVSGAYLENRQISHEFHSPAVQALFRYGDKSQPAGPGKAEKPGLTPEDQEKKKQEFIDQQKSSGKTDEEIQAMMGGLEEPWVDPLPAASGGFAGAGKVAWSAGMKLMPALARSITAAGVGAIADYPVGIATEKVGEKYPRLAMPFNVLTGMVSGMSVENLLEKSIIKAFSKKGVKPSAQLVRDAVERVKTNLQAEKVDDELTASVVKDINAEYGEKPLQGVGEGDIIPPRAAIEPPFELETRLNYVLGDSSKPLVELAPETEKKASLFLQTNIQDLPEKAVNINFANIKSSDDVQEAIAKTADLFSSGIDAARRGMISNEETGKLADLLGMDVKTLLKRRKGEAFNAEQATAARSILVSSAEHLVELSKKASSIDANDIDRFEFIKHLNVHYAVQAQVSGMTAEAGRALQAFGISVAGMEGQTKAIKELLENLPGGMSTSKIAEMVSHLDTVEGVNTFARQIRRATTFDMVLEAWINGLLSGPQTHATNTLSNTLFAVWQIPERFVAAGIGQITGSRAVKAQEAISQAYGLMEGLQDGWKLAAKALRTGEPSEQLTKVETRVHRAITAENLRETIPGRLIKKISPNALEQGGMAAQAVDLMGEMVRVPGRLLTAEDELFKSVGYKMELHARANRQAIDEGLKGVSMAKRIQEIIQNPEEIAPDIHMAAVDASRYQTFTQPLGEIGRKFQGILSQVPVLRLITPFVRTPVNIMKGGFERTPLAFASRRFWSEIGAGGARRDLALARVSMGSTAMISTGYLAAQGLITGGGPSDPEMQAALRRTGWQPYSMRIGDTYISFNRLEPLGILLGAAADFTEIAGLAGEEMQPEMDKLAAAIALALSKNVTSKTWMKGVSEAIEAIHDPDRYGQRYIQNFARSMVPALFAQVERTMDPEMEAVYSIIDAMKSRIPGLSSDLPPRRDLWGEPITTAYSKDRSWIETAFSALSPFYLSKAKDSPIDRELIRLRLPIAKPKKVMSFEGVALNLPPHEYDRFLVLMNTVPLNSTGKGLKSSLDDMVKNDPQYRSASPDMKEVHIKRYRNEAMALANIRLLEESPALRMAVDYGHIKQQAEAAQ